MAYHMVEVAILAGSASDSAVVERTAAVLRENGISYETRVISAHREPDTLDDFIESSTCKIFIAIAGLSAALPGIIASKTNRPVIGVPVSGYLMGFDALLSIAQMPKGVPVACVGIDNGENAALLAIRILSVK